MPVSVLLRCTRSQRRLSTVCQSYVRQQRAFSVRLTPGRRDLAQKRGGPSIAKSALSLLRTHETRYSISSNKDDVLSGRGIVIGCYDTEEGGYELTDCGKDLDLQTKGKVMNVINMSGGQIKKGDSRLFYDITDDHAHLAVVGLGPRNGGAPDVNEDMDVGRQNVRSAAAVGTKMLQNAKVADILLDDLDDAEACAEGSTLSLFSFDKLKAKKKRKKIPNINLLSTKPAHSDKWIKGRVLAEAQNFARDLMESPGNHMTPTMFVETVSNKLGGVRLDLSNPGSLQVIPRTGIIAANDGLCLSNPNTLAHEGLSTRETPLSWIQSKDMGAFLSIAKGSTEEPWLLEVRYNYNGVEGTSEQPTVLVGKGVTFDTGGISIKPSASMGLMRGDMGGAACVVSTVMALAQLECPTSVVGLVPLAENMPSGCAVKPGDVVRAMNGKTIEVDNTDAEGRLLLADTLCYAHSFNPKAIIDLATLTGAIDVALGSGAAAVFTTSNSLWQQLHEAGHMTGDRVWRMPLYSQYSKQVESHLADVSNVGTKGRSAGACTAAAFLKEFVEVEEWAHMDIAGVMDSSGEVPFLSKGMTGRPTRTLIQYLLKDNQ